MKKLSTISVAVGLVASLLGFAVSYWTVIKYEPRIYHFIFITLGLVAALYGFFQAFRAIRLGKIEVRKPLYAVLFNSAGLVATLYGFSQAFRGLHHLPHNWVATISFLLVSIGLAGALFGFLQAFKLIHKFRSIRSAA